MKITFRNMKSLKTHQWYIGNETTQTLNHLDTDDYNNAGACGVSSQFGKMIIYQG